MEHFFDAGAVATDLPQHLADAVDIGARIVIDTGRYFLGMTGAVLVQEDDIGEGAADVYPDAKTWHVGTLRLLPSQPSPRGADRGRSMAPPQAPIPLQASPQGGKGYPWSLAPNSRLRSGNRQFGR